MRGWNGLTYQDWGQMIEKGLQTLTARERRTLDLAYFQGLLLKEIAEQMQEPLSNIRNHYYRGLKKLRSFLQAHGCMNRTTRLMPRGCHHVQAR